jgi:hypothetical protein
MPHTVLGFEKVLVHFIVVGYVAIIAMGRLAV